MTVKLLPLVLAGMVVAAGSTMADESGAPLTIGGWLAEDIGGGGVVDRVHSSLDIGADGRITGSGGCNRMAGTAEFTDVSIRFGAIAATRMACPPAVMDQEAKFFAALEAARSWKIDTIRRKLMLRDQAGNTLVVLAAE